MSAPQVPEDAQIRDERVARRHPSAARRGQSTARRDEFAVLLDDARVDRDAQAAQDTYDLMARRMIGRMSPPTAEHTPATPAGSARAGTRRRGSELDDAIIGAAWDELVAVGFDGLTYDGVARRAQTTRSVIYRRWPTLMELAKAAILRSQEFRRMHVPDTGTLRDDIVASLTANSMTDARIALASFLFAGHFRTVDSHSGDGQVMDSDIPAQDPILAPEVFLRAQRRGQIDLTGLPESVLKVPTALLVGRMLETLKPPSPAEIESIVDEIFIPLLRAYGALPAAEGADQATA